MSFARKGDSVPNQREHEAIISKTVDLIDAQHGDLLYVDASGDSPTVRSASQLGLLAPLRKFLGAENDTGDEGAFDGLLISQVDEGSIRLTQGAGLIEENNYSSWVFVIPQNVELYDEFGPPHATLDRMDAVLITVDTDTGEPSVVVVPGVPEDPAGVNWDAVSAIEPHLFIGTVLVPSDEPDATAWTVVNEGLVASFAYTTGRVRIKSRDQSTVFIAVSSGVPGSESAGFFDGQIQKSNRPSLSYNTDSFSAGEIQALKNLLIEFGLATQTP